MSLNVMLSSTELAAVNREVDAFNKALNAGKTTTAGGEMGKDEFLKILITQLSHQDPTQPMQDKEFIAQMAQFSSLEQMTNVSAEISKVAALLTKGQAVSLLGRMVEVVAGQPGRGGHGRRGERRRFPADPRERPVLRRVAGAAGPPRGYGGVGT